MDISGSGDEVSARNSTLHKSISVGSSVAIKFVLGHSHNLAFMELLLGHLAVTGPSRGWSSSAQTPFSGFLQLHQNHLSL